jgi:hypothetical protein
MSEIGDLIEGAQDPETVFTLTVEMAIADLTAYIKHHPDKIEELGGVSDWLIDVALSTVIEPVLKEYGSTTHTQIIEGQLENRGMEALNARNGLQQSLLLDASIAVRNEAEIRMNNRRVIDTGRTERYGWNN